MRLAHFSRFGVGIGLSANPPDAELPVADPSLQMQTLPDGDPLSPWMQIPIRCRAPPPPLRCRTPSSPDGDSLSPDADALPSDADPLPPGHVNCDACWKTNPLPPHNAC